MARPAFSTPCRNGLLHAGQVSSCSPVHQQGLATQHSQELCPPADVSHPSGCRVNTLTSTIPALTPEPSHSATLKDQSYLTATAAVPLPPECEAPDSKIGPLPL